MATIVLFRCARFPFDDIAHVVETDDLRIVLQKIEEDTKAIVLIGPRVPRVESQAVITAIANRRGYFLRLRDEDSPEWIRRLIRFALSSR